MQSDRNQYLEQFLQNLFYILFLFVASKITLEPFNKESFIILLAVANILSFVLVEKLYVPINFFLISSVDTSTVFILFKYFLAKVVFLEPEIPINIYN